MDRNHLIEIKNQLEDIILLYNKVNSNYADLDTTYKQDIYDSIESIKKLILLIKSDPYINFIKTKINRLDELWNDYNNNKNIDIDDIKHFSLNISYMINGALSYIN